MPEPITLLIGAAAVSQLASAALQAYEGAKARKANREELRRIESLISKIQEPDFDLSDVNPVEYKVVAKYNPEIDAKIGEVLPEKLKLASAEAKMARDARRRTLEHMLRITESGEDPIAAIDRERAARSAAAEAASARATAQAEMARRGQALGGLGYASALAGASDAMNRMALADEEAVANRERARRDAAMSAAGMAGRIYDDEAALERYNVDAINEFNRRIAERTQDMMRYNMMQDQRVADANVGLANERGAIRRGIKQQQFDNALRKVGLMTNQAERNIQENISASRDRGAMYKQGADAISGAATTYGAYKHDEEMRRKYPHTYG